MANSAVMPRSRTCDAAAKSAYVDLMPARGAEKPPLKAAPRCEHCFAKGAAGAIESTFIAPHNTGENRSIKVR
jgi:hypothetical protein